ncbi:hypothetical protein AYK24_07195 [Thermoplasmatales archaeon SG8-52-4]|nr:MAG: hypothetical protein AYK24_07195 [Thermoplasmatales archaeon SG8-52-4]
MGRIEENILILRLFYFFRIFEISFYMYAFRWYSKNKKRIPNKITPKDILKLFYLDFLNIQKKDCKIIEITNNRLITRCKNKCPILELSQNLNIDTKKSCRQISEGPCKYFLKKLDRNINFKRNYNHIRPYKEDCEEVITINNDL